MIPMDTSKLYKSGGRPRNKGLHVVQKDGGNWYIVNKYGDTLYDLDTVQLDEQAVTDLGSEFFNWRQHYPNKHPKTRLHKDIVNKAPGWGDQILEMGIVVFMTKYPKRTLSEIEFVCRQEGYSLDLVGNTVVKN